MKVLMLGWEYPPHISGGLGTACEGLTKALARLRVEVKFVVPHLYGGERGAHMTLLDANRGLSVCGESSSLVEPDTGDVLTSSPPIEQISIDSFLTPYLRPFGHTTTADGDALFLAMAPDGGDGIVAQARRRAAQLSKLGRGGGYGERLFLEVERYAANVVARCAEEDFDLIHAHDWMTYPAALALHYATGKPFIVHVHSLEYDRSGQGGNGHIQHIEGTGISRAAAVVAVSYYTRAIIRQEHPIPIEKIHVVHNGVYPREVVESYKRERGTVGPTVLFLGRITFQKGPENFVEAAAKVLPFVPNATFVMAGAGDLLPRMRQRVRELGLEDHFVFPGFLRGGEVEEMFSTADVYVMPSVSEPFGISALEAISFDTPVIISRQSGVSEVLQHALKVDFWDVDRLAELITHALQHEELRRDMVEMAREELQHLRWDAAAIRTLGVYRSVLSNAGG